MPSSSRPPAAASDAPALSASQSRFAKFAQLNVFYNLLVILWGAFVRATGSGAGCGDHWPTCNGEVVPRAPALETVIEFVHRLTSGGALILAVVLVVAAVRVWPKGSMVRRAAGATLGFMVVEALVGAAIVLLQMTAQDDSIGRAVVMGIHLVNTLLLLAAMVLTAWFATGRPVPSISDRRADALLLGLAGVGMLVLGASGGVTALGDTLFPADSLAEGLAQDLSPTAHILVRLRVFHPLIAVLVGGYTLVVAMLTGLSRAAPTRRAALVLVGLVIGQVVLGGLNVVLLAPVWMQLLHLLMADLVWITLVLLTVNVLTTSHSTDAQSVHANSPLA